MAEHSLAWYQTVPLSCFMALPRQPEDHYCFFSYLFLFILLLKVLDLSMESILTKLSIFTFKNLAFLSKVM